ncbi:MAG: TRAP transporter small permease [Clostridia bacterium]|nr:TRAP transporter small permease [Clostridia bacterium]
MLEKFESILVKFDPVFKWMSTIILGGMTILIFIQVVFRYVFTNPLAWSEEIAKYLFIWMTFIGGYVGARQNKHIGVEALQKALPGVLGKGVKSLAYLITAAFFIIVLYNTCAYWPRLAMQTSPALEIPITFVYLSMIIGSLFMALWYILLALKVFQKKKEEVKA